MKTRIVLSLVTLIALAAGCGKPESQPPGTAASAPSLTPITIADLDAVAKSPKPWRLALVVKTRNNPFFDPMIKAAEAEAQALGVALDVQAPPQESDKERQFAIVQDLTARGLDALLIAPADSKGIVPALKQAQAKGVLLINVDNRVDGPTAAAQGVALGGYVGADNEAGGRIAGEAMVRLLGDGAKVAILEGIRGADNAESRKRGFRAGVAGKQDVIASDTAEWDTQKAYAKFQSMLAARPEIQGLFCANDKMAIGALKAIRESGKQGRVSVIGYDNIPDVQPYLASGEMAGSIDQHPELMGKYGVRMAVGVLNGVIPKCREFLVPLEFISKK
jgi:ribose transport system substrate-binding protein